MKMGLILSHKGINYGMLLQAYATQVYIESKGVSTEIISIQENGNTLSRIKKLARYFSPVALKSALMKAKRRKIINSDIELRKAHQSRQEVGKDFVDSKLHGFRRFKGYEEATEYAKEHYSCVMIGSDQQWAPACFYSKLNTLMFVPKGVKRASYATSMGVSTIPKNTHSLLRSFISEMDYVSVREETGKKIITNVTGRTDVQVVPDPTFLLTCDDWRNYIPEELLIDSPYIFCYFLGNYVDPVKKVLSLARRRGIKAVFVRNVESYSTKKVDYEDAVVIDAPTVDQFVNYIRHADLVCTDSFHCTVFSLINNVEFATFYRTKSDNKDSRNSRIDDLLTQFECTGRICDHNSVLDNVVNNSVDWRRINNIMVSMRSIGQNYLEGILHE